MAIESGQTDRTALADDLRAILDEMDRTDKQARALVTGFSEAQLNWQPGGGTGWSVAQCLDHLAQSTALYAPALLEAVRRAKAKASSPHIRKPIQPPWLGRWFIRDLEPPPKRKSKAPKKVIPPAQLKSAEVLKAFLAAHDQVRALVQEARELDLNRIRFRNPLLRIFPWTVGTGLFILGAHDRRHLWQAQQVLKVMEQETPATKPR
ncbi:MAG TPA: DinB family protein [Candidatus Angelobacter sp.]|nr:DinB family protein [Candidatus Angelobacter sp.]